MYTAIISGSSHLIAGWLFLNRNMIHIGKDLTLSLYRKSTRVHPLLDMSLPGSLVNRVTVNIFNGIINAHY